MNSPNIRFQKDAALSLVIGRRGSGKTTMVKQLIASKSALVVFDPRREYAAEIGATQVETLPAMVDAIRAGWQSGFKVAYVPKAGQEPAELHAVCSALWAIQRPYELSQDSRKLCLVVDEMSLSYPTYALPADLDGMPRIVNQGRHVGIEVIGLTQKPANIAATFREQIEYLYVFAMTAGPSRDWVIQEIGRERKDQLGGLVAHQYIYIENGLFQGIKKTVLR